jgi:hypothetical protein
VQVGGGGGGGQRDGFVAQVSAGRGVGSCFCFYGKFVENGWYFVPNIRISDWN